MTESVGLVKRPRTANYSEKELEILTDDASLHQDVLNAPFSSVVSNSTKTKILQDIADKINATCGTNRTAVELRKKWNDYKCQLGRKIQRANRELHRTGGGPAHPLPMNDIEQKVISLIPSCQIEGIPGGLETTIEAITPDSEICVEGTQVLEIPPESSSSGEQYTLTEMVADGSLQTEAILSPGALKLTYVKPMKEEKEDNVTRLVELDGVKVDLLRDLVRISQERLEEDRKRTRIEERRLEIEERRLMLEEKRISSQAYLPNTVRNL